MLRIETEGLHPSSVSCLEALHWLHERETFHHILEIGCGSGILSAAAASIWDATVLAADISEKAVEDTLANIKAHALGEKISVIRSDGFSHPDIAQNAPYDLMICNLLAELQARIAKDIKKHLKTNGYVILSGILAWEAAETEQAFIGLGFEIAHKISSSPWMTYVVRHTTET